MLNLRCNTSSVVGSHVCHAAGHVSAVNGGGIVEDQLLQPLNILAGGGAHEQALAGPWNLQQPFRHIDLRTLRLVDDAS